MHISHIHDAHIAIYLFDNWYYLIMKQNYEITKLQSYLNNRKQFVWTRDSKVSQLLDKVCPV